MATAVSSSIKLLIGVAIFAGLPLVGWGVKDVQGFFGHPARLGYALTVIMLQIIVVIRLPDVGSRRGAGEKVVSRKRVTFALLQVIPLAVVVAAPYCDRRGVAVLGELDIVRYLGLCLFALGFMGMHWAEASLGKQFSVEVTIQDDHKLVTDGLYRYLRHPRYLSIIIFLMGISLVFRSWLALILVAALTMVLIWRIRDEEALLHQTFGTDWDAYSQRSWRLIPFVY